MKNNVLKRKDYLNLLASTKSKKKRDKLIEVASPSDISAISEIIANSLAGNVPLKSKHVSKMRRHRKKLRLISQKRYPVKRKKALIKQTGGILGAIIPLALQTITSLFKKFTT